MSVVLDNEFVCKNIAACIHRVEQLRDVDLRVLFLSLVGAMEFFDIQIVVHEDDDGNISERFRDDIPIVGRETIN
jgi:hypothetical protein